jgi:hypothetical protein
VQAALVQSGASTLLTLLSGDTVELLNTNVGDLSSSNVRLLTVNIDLTSLSPSQGFIVQGSGQGAHHGWSVSSVGDINGDGWGDLIVGAPQQSTGGTGAGAAYVIFGSDAGFGAVDGTGRSVIDLRFIAPSQGFIIQGDAVGDRAGWSVSSAGDVNGDGYDDLLVGAPYFGESSDAYVIFGLASGFDGILGGNNNLVIDLSNLSPSQGFVMQGNSGDALGFSVSSAGDINSDGYDDLIIGAPNGPNFSASGQAYLLFGSGAGFGTVDGTGRSVIDLTSSAPSHSLIIEGDFLSPRVGNSVSSLGDINGDGFDDVIVGAPNSDSNGEDAGEAYIFFGSSSGLRPGGSIQGYEVNGYAGLSVSSAGDIDGDGYDDFLVGASGSNDSAGDNAGETYVLFGSASGFGAADGTGLSLIDLANLLPSHGFVMQGADFSRSGRSVSSAGDINGDGYDDLIVGSQAGAYVVFGLASGFGSVDGTGRSVIDLTNLAPSQGFIIQGDAASDNAGRSVSSAGDINGDGYDDLTVGAPYGDDGGVDAGEAYVIFGSAYGASTDPQALTGTAGADQLIGGVGNDTLTGNGGADVFRGGAGDDRIEIADTGFLSVHGGRGMDTLALEGSGLTLDLTTTPMPRVASIEALDLNGTGSNSLVIDQLAVFDVTEVRDTGLAIVRVQGGADDSVSFSDSGWSAGGNLSGGGIIYSLYTNGNAEVWVELGVSVTLPASASDTGQSDKVQVAAASFSLADGVTDLGMEGGASLFSLSGGVLDLTLAPDALDTGARELVPQPAGTIELHDLAGFVDTPLAPLDSLTDHDALLWDLHIQDVAWIDGVAVLQYEA